jgi:hypothetical protein
MTAISSEIAGSIDDRNNKMQEDMNKSAAEKAERDAANRKKQDIMERERLARVEDLKKWKEEQKMVEPPADPLQRQSSNRANIAKFQDRVRTDLARKSEKTRSQKEQNLQNKSRSEEAAKR